MSIGVGIIGAGVMGADHARIIARQVAGAHLVAISDADESRARAVAAETGAKLALNDPMAVIHDPAVGAVLIASPDKTLKVYDGLYHEILNEPERDTVLADIRAWIDRHV